MIEFGRKYRDLITGFEGIATGYVSYITGCNQALLAPESTKDTLKSSEWIDEKRLILDETSIKIELLNTSDDGFDIPAPKI